MITISFPNNKSYGENKRPYLDVVLIGTLRERSESYNCLVDTVSHYTSALTLRLYELLIPGALLVKREGLRNRIIDKEFNLHLFSPYSIAASPGMVSGPRIIE